MARGQGTAVKVAGFDNIKPGDELEQPTMAGEAAVKVVELGNQQSEAYYAEKLTFISNRLEKLALEQVTAKSLVEQRWLDAVRAYHGKYPLNFYNALTAAKTATAFVKATRAKTVALEARLFDLMFPTDDRNWDISPTPVPKLADEQKEAETRAKNAAAQANLAETAGNPDQAQQIVAAGNDEAARAQAAANEIARATQAAKLMREEMDDQLVESKYPAETRAAIHDMCLLGSGILKGPMVNEKTRGRWMPAQGEGAQPHQFELVQQDDVRPMVRRVDPWSFFPDMSARCVEECEFFFERYLWTKSDLRKMVATQGFNPDAVRELLRDDRTSRSISSPSINNLVTLRSLTEESTGQITGRFVGWEYHGSLELGEICDILSATGDEEYARQLAEEDDPLIEHRVVVHFCDGVILKIAPEYPLDSGEALYSMANLEEAEGQLFGYGVPTIMADSQEALNSAWRMSLDNGALSVGPQAMIEKDAIAPADGSWAFTPRKIWWRVKAALATAAKPIEFFDVPNNMEEFVRLIELANVFIDMETGIPMPQQGEETRKTDTVGGMAILQNASNIIFRRIVKNVDDGLIAPTMRRLYDWNMQFSKRPEIKGDMQVDARGTSVLLVKEVQAQNLMLVVSNLLANPNIAPMLKAFPAVEKLFQAMMIKPSEVMVTEDDYKQYLEQQANQPPPPSPQEIAAQARIEAANIQAQVSKLRDQTALQIAELRRESEMLALAENGDIKLSELRTMLEKSNLDNQSKERMLVAEAAIDHRNAEAARARGEEPAGSGGSVNEGVENG